MFNKKFAIILGLFVAVMIGFSVVVIDVARNAQSTTIVLPVLKKSLVKIDGMTCESCEISLAEAAKKMEGVVSLKASAVDGEAVVEYDLVLTSMSTIMSAISETGFKAVSYEEYTQPVEKNASIKTPKVIMKCGAGKCGAGKCGDSTK